MQQLRLFNHIPNILPDVSTLPKTSYHELCYITLAGQVLPYRFKRSSKRRTIGLAIDEHGLWVTAPRWVGQPVIDATLVEKEKWIFSKLVEMRQRQEQQLIPTVRWEDGSHLPYLGSNLSFRFTPDEENFSPSVSFNQKEKVLHIGLPLYANANEIKHSVLDWLKQQARTLFTKRLDYYASRLGVHYNRFSISSASTRWGSCNENGHIRLNWRLIHFSPTVIDYVVAHELAHLKEMNHSPKFWQVVASIFPDYENARAQLKQPLPIL